MVNNLGELNTVERTMEFIENLKKLVCYSGGQVDTLVRNVMRKEHWVVNGDRPNGKDVGTGRVKDFLTDGKLVDPRNNTTSRDDGSTTLQRKDESSESRLVELNNNP